LADHAVLALVQIAVGLFALFVAISFPMHLWNRRWVRGLTKDGFGVDDKPVDRELDAAMAEIKRLKTLSENWQSAYRRVATSAGVAPLDDP